MLSDLRKTITSLTYPHYCPVCRQPWESGFGYICPGCWDHLTVIDRKTSDSESKFRQKIRVVYKYSDDARQLVHRMKFHHRNDIATVLGKKITEILESDSLFEGVEFLIPVPLHPARLRERGYNQSEIIAKAISYTWKIPVRTDIIHRSRNTSPQSRLSDHDRKRNVRDAFIPNANKMRTNVSNVMLIDDVIHTGTTIYQCMKALNEAGLKNISAVVAFG